MYLVTYSVSGGSMEGYHNAIVLSCELIEQEFNVPVLEDNDMGSITQFRWWFDETSWIEIRTEEHPVKVGSEIVNLPQRTWMR